LALANESEYLLQKHKRTPNQWNHVDVTGQEAVGPYWYFRCQGNNKVIALK